MKPQTGLMSTITTDRPICTLINVFTVAPGSQRALVDVLMEATERVMRHVPGIARPGGGFLDRVLSGCRIVQHAAGKPIASGQQIRQLSLKAGILCERASC
jgi:hypothetical protein